MVEVAVGFFLFIFGILFLLWLGLLVHYKRTLTTSLGKALRLAVTRSDPTLGPPAIPELTDYANGGFPTPHVQRLLSRNNLPDGSTDWGTAVNFYNDLIDNAYDVPGVTDFNDLPASYLYALAYFYEGMKLSIGTTVRYPCDPSPTNADGAGCIMCRFPNPVTHLPKKEGDPDDEFSGSSIPETPVELFCQFRPANFIIDPMIRLLKVMAGDAAAPNFTFSLYLQSP